ncbi:hypothetical protein CIG75_10685 [Tumebacillus algifaecis]|uniref:Uncharacterized protein n=1 Tax=Tumebacillus algifaecis TaxID=1214604 RepID=A0A223D0X5_9BACL|nr:hypothetical protein [Tumebacillus algifaecis]ASS75409.1 hypothetical protein CIG75_10685 [Tumebacillus algifaecis]
MNTLTLLIIPLFYLILLLSLYLGVMGVIKRSIPSLLASAGIGCVAAYVSMWSIGRFLIVIPILALSFAGFYLFKNRTMTKARR